MTMLSAADRDVTYIAVDPEGDRVNLSLRGADHGRFKLATGGVLGFRTGADFENPTDANGDNVYEVTVRASDGALYEDRMVAVSVINANEAPIISSGPSIRGMSRVTFEENGTGDVENYEVVGLEAGASVSWSLSGDDARAFNDISTAGALSFKSPPDYENPADADTNNVYEVTVMAESGDDSAMLNVRVTVTDMEPEVLVNAVARYDTDGTSGIQISELLNAVEDFFNADIELSITDLLDVIDAFFEG